MAADGGLVPAQVFHCPEQFKGQHGRALVERFGQTGGETELFQVTPQVMAALSEREGSARNRRRPSHCSPRRSPRSVADGQELVVVLDRPQDPGNLGGLIRTADAVGRGRRRRPRARGRPVRPEGNPGQHGLRLQPARRALRRTPVRPSATWQARASCRSARASTCRRVHLGPDCPAGGCALVLGNEARGLSPDVTPHISRWVSLPMRGKAESLNVGVAGGVLMYLWFA